MLRVSENVRKVVPPIIDAMVTQARELRHRGIDVIDLGQGVSNLHLPQELVAEAMTSATRTSTLQNDSSVRIHIVDIVIM